MNINEFLQSTDYLEVQRQIVGTCLHYGLDYYLEFCEGITKDYFSESDLQSVWQVITDLANDFEPEINTINCLKELRKKKVKEPHKLLSELTSQCVYAHTQKLYNRDRIKELYQRKIAYNASLVCLSESLNEKKDINSTILEAQNNLQIEYNNNDLSLSFLPEFADVLINSQEVMYKTHITPVDKITNGGFIAGNFGVIAARPGMGKTEIGIHIAYENAKEGNAVLYLSLEMTKEELSKRLITKCINNDLDAYLDNKRLKDKKLSEHDIKNIKEAAKMLSNLRIYVYDATDITLENLAIKAQMIARKYNIKMIILDHLHLVSSDNILNPEQAVGKVSRTCKMIAKNLQIPFISLAQLNRKVEERPNKRPNNGDLRQSGQIEQDADYIIFLYRDDYYQAIENPEHINNKEIEYIFGKNRSGSVQTGYGIIDLSRNQILDL